ncbi:MAG TPA: hypothetical protein VHV78_00305, partial [Gemmatimonadaceae bacterium]|nr:hypothetical protein [Gemmatimonadaceae bacterium]
MKLLIAFAAVAGCSTRSSYTFDAPIVDQSPDATSSTGADAPAATGPYLVTTIDPGVSSTVSLINQGTAIGEGSANGGTPFTITNLAADTDNTQQIVSNIDPYEAVGTVPDTAAGFCDYSGATPKRISYVTGAKFEGSAGTDPMVP